MKWYLHAFKNYANFDDRASRTEYWMFGLYNFCFAIVAYTIDLVFDLGVQKYGIGLIYSLYALICFIPGLALAVRRLHDVDKNGWYLWMAIIPILNIYLIILFCTESDEDSNAFGDKPNNSTIAEFIYDNKTISNIAIGCVIWLFINKITWSIITKYVDQYYQNKSFLVFNELNNLVWTFFPLLLALTVKNAKWKIALMICSVIYIGFNFYEIVKAHIYSNNFQF